MRGGLTYGDGSVQCSRHTHRAADTRDMEFTVKGRASWYQLDAENESTFATALNDLLAKGPLGAACWRPCGKDSISFSWSGRNDHEERVRAGASLCKLIVDAAGRDPFARIHLVAHSHGGNVVLAALESYYKYLVEDSRRVASAVSWRLTRVSPAMIRETRHEAEQRLEVEFSEALKETHGAAAETAFRQTKAWAVPALVEAAEASCGPILDAAWIRSDANRIGRLVFLGTPFIRYEYRAPGTVSSIVLGLLPGALVG